MFDLGLFVLATGLIILLNHPSKRISLLGLEGQLLYLRAAELGIFAHCLVMLFASLVSFLAHLWGGEHAPLFQLSQGWIEGLIRPTSPSAYRFWARSSPFLFALLWSRWAKLQIQWSDRYWQRRQNDSVAQLGLIYQWCGEGSAHRLLLEALIDKQPLLIFMKNRSYCVGLPIRLGKFNIRSGVHEEMTLLLLDTPNFEGGLTSFSSQASSLRGESNPSYPLGCDTLAVVPLNEMAAVSPLHGFPEEKDLEVDAL